MSETTKCPRCGKPQPPDSVHTCSPRRPDARPVGETAEQLIVAALMAADICAQHECAGAGSCPECTALAAKAVCAALLRDAPVVWVAMNQDASAWFHARPVHYAQDEYDGEWRWVEDQPSGGYYPAPSWLVEALGLTPGTVRRAYLVIPEGEET